MRYNIMSCQRGENQWSEKSSGLLGRHCAEIALRIITYLLFKAVSDCFLENIKSSLLTSPQLCHGMIMDGEVEVDL